MAEVLNRPALTRFWAVDKLFLAYVVFSSVLVLGWWNQVPDAAALFAVHLAGAALLVFEVKRPNRTSWLFRNWYPLPYVGFCYKEMALLIPAVRHTDADQWLANLDFRIWHVHPTVWLERIQTPLLTEFLQTVYTLFIPAVLLVACLALEETPLPGVPILCFFNRAGVPGLLCGLPDSPGAGAPFPAKAFTTHTLTGIVAVQEHAGDAGPPGIRPL